MRTAICMAVGFAALVSGVPASFAQDSGVLDQGKPAGTGGKAGISIAVPIGKISVGAESLEGEPIYVRRSTVREGITVVEVSTTPFMPDPSSGQQVAQLVLRPDQPAGW